MEAPECTLGYTEGQLLRKFGAQLPRFAAWMRGQTQAICEGKGCVRAHGIVTYRQDVEQYLRSGRPLD